MIVNDCWITFLPHLKTVRQPAMKFISFVFVTALLSVFHSQSAAQDTDFDAPVLGVQVVALSDIKQLFEQDNVDLPTKIGVVLLRVEPRGPAADAKLRGLDIVTSVNRIPVRDIDSFAAAVSKLEIGKPYEVKGFRPQEARGKVSWKRGNTKVTPISFQDFYRNNMRETVDQIRDITFYQHLDSPEQVNSNSEVYVYLSKPKNGQSTMHLRLQYVANDWLFVRRFVFKVDGKTFTVEPDSRFDIERDNDGGDVWEWYDKPVGTEELQLLESIANARSVVIRYEGDQYNKDREISNDEISRLRAVMMANRVLNAN